MTFWSKQLSSRFWASLLMALTTFLIAGCKVEDKTWIDKMLSEMETAWIEADKAGGGQDGRDKAVSLVAMKYFRPGMPMAEAFELLNQLKSQEFSIYEYRHEGTRIWPNGELKPYADEARKKKFEREISQETSRFTVRKDQYGRERLLISKGVAMTLTVDTKKAVVISVEANIWASSI